MIGNTSIQISRNNKVELDNLKLTPSETYDEVISRLLEFTDLKELTERSVKSKLEEQEIFKL